MQHLLSISWIRFTDHREEPLRIRNLVVDALDRTFAVRESMIGVLKHQLQIAANAIKQKADSRRFYWDLQIGQWVLLKLQLY